MVAAMSTRGDELGAHMSIAGGLHLALERGREVGCNAVQIFLKNQRQWAAKALGAEDVQAFRAARRRTGIRHCFAPGYDLRTETGYRGAMTECEGAVGRGRILAFHLNDARARLGSGLDRHEHIGRGFLGLRAFRHLLNDRRFARVPKVLETPKEPEPTADLRNLATLRKLRRPAKAAR